MLFKSLTFVPVVPDEYAKVEHVSAHFKHVTQAKPFYGFGVFFVHDQDAVRWFGVIPTS